MVELDVGFYQSVNSFRNHQKVGSNTVLLRKFENITVHSGICAYLFKNVHNCQAFKPCSSAIYAQHTYLYLQ